MNMANSSARTTQEFFQKWCPNPQDKNLRTQIGVHFEEIAEMMEQMDAPDPNTKMLIHYIKEAIKGFSDHLKTTNDTIEIKDRIEFLDGLCDQMVTAVGIGHMAKMDVAGAFGEVNRSNNSKFDKNGEPILDNNMKLVKGPFYSKPDLKSFI